MNQGRFDANNGNKLPTNKKENDYEKTTGRAAGLNRTYNVIVCMCHDTNHRVLERPVLSGTSPKIMVIGIAKKPVNRRFFEDEFVRQLKTRGTDAFDSCRVLPDNLENNHAVIAAKMKELGADGVLFSRLTSKKTVLTYVPGTLSSMPTYYGRWPDYYGYGYETFYTPGYMTEDEYAYVETNLYNGKDDKLIWSAASEILISVSDQQLIKSFIAVMVDTMVK